MKQFIHPIFLFLGLLFLGIGSIGIFLPILPTVPFYLLSVFFLTKSSKRLSSWVTNSKSYKKHVEAFQKKQPVPLKRKIFLIVMITIVFGGAILLSPHLHLQFLLGFIWLVHFLYFGFIVKTAPSQERVKEE